jgi:ABC-type transport system involved in multi-copper enzyme maturation permease subunit
MFSLFKKTLYDKRSFIIGWGLGMAFIAFLMTVFYPAFHQDNGISQLIESLPPAFQGLVGDLNNLKEMSTYLGSQLFDIRMPIFLSIFTIILAAGLTTTEEEGGQMRTLAAMPISRVGILFAKWFSGVFISLVISLTTAAGIGIGLMVIGESLDILVLVRLCAMMLLLAVTIFTMIFSIGLISGKKGITTGLGVIITVGSFLLTTFAQSVDWLVSYERFSILHFFHAPEIATGTIHPSDVAVYGVIIVVFIVTAIVVFRRRDLN